MGVMEAVLMLDNLVDESDPDVSISYTLFVHMCVYAYGL